MVQHCQREVGHEAGQARKTTFFEMITPPEENLDKVINTLTNTCQLIDGWHTDCSWSAFDEQCRQEMSELLKQAYVWKQVIQDRKNQSVANAKMVQEEVECAIDRCLKEGDVTYAETIGALELVKAATIRRYFKNVEKEES